MANEIRFPYTPGQTGLYCTATNPVTNQIWNGAAYEAPLTANWATYKIVLTEVSTTGIFLADKPAAMTKNMIEFDFYQQVGGSAAPTDTYLGAGVAPWNYDG